MRIGNAHQVEHPLHRAVFARDAVERVEYDVGCGFGGLSVGLAPLFLALGTALALIAWGARTRRVRKSEPSAPEIAG